VVTRVELQARAGSERVNVHLDGAYAFSLAADIGMPLREGQHLDETAVRELRQRDDAERAYQHALHFLAPRPRSSSEVRRRLREHDHAPEAIAVAVERLQVNGLLDDTEFAAYWVGQRQTFHPRGPRALQAELRQKGVSRDAAEAVIESASEQQGDDAYRAGLKKSRSLPAGDERAFARTLSAFLVRRGFDYEAVRSATRRLWAERIGTAEELMGSDVQEGAVAGSPPERGASE
jgi:regulatory protein